MNQNLKSLVLMDSILLADQHLCMKDTKAVLINKVEDQYHIIIENPYHANSDNFLVINKSDLDFFKEKPFEDKLKEDFPGLRIISDRYIYNEEGELTYNDTNSNVFIMNDGYVVAKFQNCIENDRLSVKEEFYDETFEKQFEQFLYDKNEKIKALFESNFIEINRNVDRSGELRVFFDYVSDFKNGIRSYEEQLAHEYIAENRLRPETLRRLSFKEDLIIKNFPIVDLQLGNIYKITEDHILENDKKLHKDDFYQIVKRSNDRFYFELVSNVNEIRRGKGKERAIIFNGTERSVREILRNVTAPEVSKLKNSDLFVDFKIGEEIEFKFDKFKAGHKSRENKDILIKKGSKGVIIESDYKVRILVTDPDTNNIMFKDLYRSEVLTITNKTGVNYNWMALPFTTSVEYQGKWFTELPLENARLYYNGNIVGELENTGELDLPKNIKRNFDLHVADLFKNIKASDIKNTYIPNEDKRVLTVNYLMKDQFNDINFSEYVQQFVSKNENKFKNKYH